MIQVRWLFATSLFAAFAVIAACSHPVSEHAPPAPVDSVLTAVSQDGVEVTGDAFLVPEGDARPVILLFHQGGSNGRGEYGPIVPWLNALGFSAIAWDLRAGGETYGASNRTAATLAPGTPAEYCDAYADIEAALTYTMREGLAESVVLWGSSYSGALVFRAAAEHPEAIAGVIAFSPASGGPLINCRARQWASEISVPRLAIRPGSEMAYEASVEQQDVLTAAGVTFHIVENGVHGSSMLVDARTKADMTETRAYVAAWLNGLGD